MYPHWNARDNYRFGTKKKKRTKREKAIEASKGNWKTKHGYKTYIYFILFFLHNFVIDSSTINLLYRQQYEEMPCQVWTGTT